MKTTLGKIYLDELVAEATASRKCLEAYKADLFEYKPHEKSMKLGSLMLMTAEIPRWISASVEEGVIDFATWKSPEFKTADDLLKMFDANMEKAKQVLAEVTDERLEDTFTLQSGPQVLMTSTLKEMVSSTINHWVHHRGQLTVYLRLNNIPVPSIYGPSADDQSF
jgi:uncharacterized damage-inducible protein DinB